MLAVIDGEHYPPVVVDALARVARHHEVVGAVLVGGTEKIASVSADTYGVPFVRAAADMETAFEEAIAKFAPERVVDLSDEPVVGYTERFRLASHALARDLPYEGPDFWLVPPARPALAARPSIAVVGTGKRVGKTAVSAYLARRCKARGRLPIVVAMGRGGPAIPELVRGDEAALDVDYLIGRAAAGAHAASDYFEDAVMSRVPTVGCRRCGGGLAGGTYIDNVAAGAGVANTVTDAQIQIYEGSGAATPPVATDASLLVASAFQPLDYIAGLFGTYRLLRADLLIVTMCESVVPPATLTGLVQGVHRERPGLPIICTVFRPKPLSSIRGRRVFLASTAARDMVSTLSAHLERYHECEVIAASPSLSDRKALVADIRAAGPFDTMVTELKAAAVDVAATEARRRGAEVVLFDNEPVDAGEAGALDAALDSLTEIALERFSPPR